MMMHIAICQDYLIYYPFQWNSMNNKSLCTQLNENDDNDDDENDKIIVMITMMMSLFLLLSVNAFYGSSSQQQQIYIQYYQLMLSNVGEDRMNVSFSFFLILSS